MKKRGCITFVFDDGYRHILEDVVTVLEDHQFAGVFAIPTDEKVISNTTGLDVAPWSEWLPLRHRGHEIAAHGVMHRDLTTLSPENLITEITQPRQLLSATTLVYPGGAYSADVQQMAATQYTAARTTDFGFESLSPQQPYALKTINYTRHNFSLAKANFRAVVAYIMNWWLIETFHIVSDYDTKLSHQISLADFQKHVRFVARIPLMVKTIQAVVSPPL